MPYIKVSLDKETLNITVEGMEFKGGKCLQKIDGLLFATKMQTINRKLKKDYFFERNEDKIKY